MFVRSGQIGVLGPKHAKSTDRLRRLQRNRHARTRKRLLARMQRTTTIACDNTTCSNSKKTQNKQIHLCPNHPCAAARRYLLMICASQDEPIEPAFGWNTGWECGGMPEHRCPRSRNVIPFTSSLKSQVSSLRSQVSGLRSQVSGLRSQPAAPSLTRRVGMPRFARLGRPQTYKKKPPAVSHRRLLNLCLTSESACRA